MFSHPYGHLQIAADRQRDQLAAVEQDRRAAEFRAMKRSSRQVTAVGEGLRRVLSTLAIRRTVKPA
jgi:hypothetical protein